MEKIKTLFNNAKEKIAMIPIMIMGMINMASLNAYATGLGSGTEDADASSIFGSIIGVILDLVRYAGIILAVWGVVQFFLALRNEDGDSKARAGLTIVAGVALIAIKSLVANTGLITL